MLKAEAKSAECTAEKLKGLKEFKKLNILIAEHEVECLKELKRQKDEYLKRVKSCRVRGLKELKKGKKD